jgi:hypothetical protein
MHSFELMKTTIAFVFEKVKLMEHTQRNQKALSLSNQTEVASSAKKIERTACKRMRCWKIMRKVEDREVFGLSLHCKVRS